ncbi:hypothetical protein AB0M20_40185 [Actinoplanes sp. NPDC051633]
MGIYAMMGLALVAVGRRGLADQPAPSTAGASDEPVRTAAFAG